jgi:hypothetical protein
MNTWGKGQGPGGTVAPNPHKGKGENFAID